MNKVFKNTGLALSLLFVGSVFAQDSAPESSDGVSNDWHISIGLSYRNFKSPKFRSATSPSGTVAIASDGNLYSIDTSVDNGGLGYVNELIGNQRERTIEVLTTIGGGASSKGSYGLFEQTGPVVGFEYALTQNDSITLNLAANFQYFMLDSASRHGSINGGATSYIYPIYSGSIGPVALSEANVGSATGGFAKTDMDMELYVFDLGLSVDYEFESSIVLSLAAGPSISLADINSSTKAYGSLGGLTKRHDDDLEFEYGFYVSGGIAYWFSEKMGLSFDIRYDNAFGEVGTKYVSQNLDAWSGQIQLLLRF